jgi:hypothetical protein
VWLAAYVVLPSEGPEITRLPPAKRLDDGAPELKVGDKGNACVDCRAADMHAVGAPERVIFSGNLDDEIHVSSINQVDCLELIPRLLLEGRTWISIRRRASAVHKGLANRRSKDRRSRTDKRQRAEVDDGDEPSVQEDV